MFVENSTSSWAPIILILALLLAPASTFFFCKALVEMLFFLRQLIVFIISAKVAVFQISIVFKVFLCHR